MAKRGRRSKKNNSNINLAVVICIVLSILLGILIYTKSGYIGKTLSPFLGGIMGWAKGVIPIGTFIIGIYIAVNKENTGLTKKLIQYGIFLLCIMTILSVYQISKENINIEFEFERLLKEAYSLGEKNIGGGAVGTAIAVLLISLVGQMGTIIIAIGIGLILLIYMFGITPADMIAGFIEEYKQNKDEKKELKEREKVNLRKGMQKEEKGKKGRIKKEEELSEILDEQLVININESNINASGVQEVKPVETDGLFKKEEVQKEDKTKEVLTLEHTLTVEDEHYEFPPLKLLKLGQINDRKNSKKNVTETATKLQKTLYSFGVSAKVENVSVGPSITRYELKPAEGVRVNKIANLSDDIALNLAATSIRIEAPIPGKQAVGIEIPNKENEVVHLRDILESNKFIEDKSKLAFALGKNIAGEETVTDIASMPHVLIAGATGSGKSVCINTLITSIIYKAKPSEVKLVMIDPKVVELSVYNGIPHLLIPVVTDPKKAASALTWAVQEMVNRYALFATKGVRDIKGYNKELASEGGSELLPQIVIIIDELADLMMVAPNDVEDAICRLAQMARAAGMHLVVATQRPSVDVITGIIKANIPSRISFAVTSQVDSRTILDMVGAEKLLGKGDMLFYPTGIPKPIRIQGAFISDKEVEKVVEFLKSQGEVLYNEDIMEKIENASSTDRQLDEQDDETDPFLMDAIETVIETGQASTSFIQRKFKVGYARAGRIIDQMEERGIISGYQGSKPREVLMPKERWIELKTGNMINDNIKSSSETIEQTNNEE